MFPEVRVALARKNMTIWQLSERITEIMTTGGKKAIRYQTLTHKLRGESELSLDEAFAIKEALESDLALEMLFRKEPA